MKMLVKGLRVAAVASLAIVGSAERRACGRGFEGGLPAPRAPDAVIYNFDTLGDTSMLDAGLCERRYPRHRFRSGRRAKPVLEPGQHAPTCRSWAAARRPSPSTS